MGMQLSSPVIAGSSNFTSKVDSIIEAEAAGAGAVVLKSLFEEQIVTLAIISLRQRDISRSRGLSAVLYKVKQR
ncbi:MAG: hypothetical protein MZV63_25435 [Marinilabiliales bacterium]|nr:hypothetical protein [Marinilabiliales bacterium]